VFRNSTSIDKEVEGLNSQLVSVQQTIDSLMMKNNAAAKHECMGLTMGQDKDTTQATQDIEQILNTYYRSLKWI